MAEQIKIPKILQERQGPTKAEQAKEKAKLLRKRASHRMGTLATKPFYYKDVTRKAAKQEKNKSEGKPHTSVEPISFEQYHQERVLKVRKLGAAAMVVPGMSLISENLQSRRNSNARRRDRKEAWKQRNGTVKSRTRERYVKFREQYPED